MQVHSALGPGLLEAAYEHCLCREFSYRGLRFERQKGFPLLYRGTRLDCGFRVDLLVDSCVIVEVKTVEALLPVHHAQLLTYLKLSRCRLGLLINFNVPHLREGIARRVL